MCINVKYDNLIMFYVSHGKMFQFQAHFGMNKPLHM